MRERGFVVRRAKRKRVFNIDERKTAQKREN